MAGHEEGLNVCPTCHRPYPRSSAYQKYTEHDVKRVVDMYQYGLSTQQIATKIGCPVGSVYWILNKSGIPLRGGKRGKQRR